MARPMAEILLEADQASRFVSGKINGTIPDGQRCFGQCHPSRADNLTGYQGESDGIGLSRRQPTGLQLTAARPRPVDEGGFTRIQPVLSRADQARLEAIQRGENVARPSSEWTTVHPSQGQHNQRIDNGKTQHTYSPEALKEIREMGFTEKQWRKLPEQERITRRSNYLRSQLPQPHTETGKSRKSGKSTGRPSEITYSLPSDDEAIPLESPTRVQGFFGRALGRILGSGSSEAQVEIKPDRAYQTVEAVTSTVQESAPRSKPGKSTSWTDEFTGRGGARSKPTSEKSSEKSWTDEFK